MTIKNAYLFLFAFVAISFAQNGKTYTFEKVNGVEVESIKMMIKPNESIKN